MILGSYLNQLIADGALITMDELKQVLLSQIEATKDFTGVDVVIAGLE